MFAKLFTGRRIAFAPLAMLAIAAIFMVCIMLLSGCASVPQAEASDPEASQAATPNTPEVPVDNGLNAFGDTFTWADGVSMSVSAPAPYSPTDMAAGLVEGHSAVVFEFVLTNNTAEALEPLVYQTLASGGVAAPGVFDVSEGLGFPPTTVILPGDTFKWNQAYSVADIASITMQITAGFGYDDAIFTNAQ